MLKINDKVRILRKNDSSWAEVGKGVVCGFTYNKAHEPVFAKVKTVQDGKVTDVEQVMPIEADRSKLVKW